MGRSDMRKSFMALSIAALPFLVGAAVGFVASAP